MQLRLAEFSDWEFLLRLRNDEAVRAASFNNVKVVAEEHKKWLRSKLANSQVRLWIVEDGDVAVGQVRADREGGEAILSIALNAKARGRGLGTEAIRVASQLVAGQLSVMKVRAKIKRDNLQSMYAFEAAGYKLDNNSATDCVEMLWEVRDAN